MRSASAWQQKSSTVNSSRNNSSIEKPAFCRRNCRSDSKRPPTVKNNFRHTWSESFHPPIFSEDANYTRIIKSILHAINSYKVAQTEFQQTTFLKSVQTQNKICMNEKKRCFYDNFRKIRFSWVNKWRNTFAKNKVVSN